MQRGDTLDSRYFVFKYAGYVILPNTLQYYNTSQYCEVQILKNQLGWRIYPGINLF